MSDTNDSEGKNEQKTANLSERIKQLGEKSTQILLFLSFALVSVATLKEKGVQSPELDNAFLWWKIALFPILASVLPLREFVWECPRWYETIRWIRFGLLWVAIAFIAWGALSFVRA